jgi:hypothetical protein
MGAELDVERTGLGFRTDTRIKAGDISLPTVLQNEAAWIKKESDNQKTVLTLPAPTLAGTS